MNSFITLVIMGFAAFGTPFMACGPHFAAPALILLIYGRGTRSLDQAVRRPTLTLWQEILPQNGQAFHIAWSATLALLGGTFVHLGIACKLNQPTLQIAILDHGDVPTFGIPIETAALVLMLVEITAGALLALGLLVRPLGVFPMGAFTFFAVTVGETQLFHANLYATMAMLLMTGASPVRTRTGLTRKEAPPSARRMAR